MILLSFWQIEHIGRLSDSGNFSLSCFEDDQSMAMSCVYGWLVQSFNQGRTDLVSWCWRSHPAGFEIMAGSTRELSSQSARKVHLENHGIVRVKKDIAHGLILPEGIWSNSSMAHSQTKLGNPSSMIGRGKQLIERWTTEMIKLGLVSYQHRQAVGV